MKKVEKSSSAGTEVESSTNAHGSQVSQPIAKHSVSRSVADFALKIATVLKESQSSTALFFVQQAYPDDIDGLAQLSSNELLDTIIVNAKTMIKDFC